MKKNIFIISNIILILLIIFFYNYKMSKSYKKNNNKNYAIFVKSGNSDNYVSQINIPIGNYILNEEKSICDNNGKIFSYNKDVGTVTFKLKGSDSCSLYFDEIVDTESPVISNLVVSGNTVTATLSDNVELSGYGLSTSNTVEPSSWTTINGTTFDLNIEIEEEGIYYLWVKDSSGNKIVSEVIDLESKGYKTILLNNGGGATTVDAAINYIKGKGTPTFTSVSTTNEGMYAAQDDLGTSYYFRGAVNNNWVKFGKDSSNKDMYWRIIRINGDGSIRMIYSGTTKPTSSTAIVMTGTGTQIGTSAFNSNDGYSIYVGYMYTANAQHGNSTSSTIKTTIDNWYKLTTLETDTTTKSLVADQIFCNDRSVTSGSFSISNPFFYSAYTRLITNKSPILTCPTESDKFTVNASNGNSKLTYPVGLITADEVAMAGGVWDTTNTSYYLYTNQYYWSGSPFDLSRDPGAREFVIFSSTITVYNYVPNEFGTRPVISLSSKAKLSGDGTWNNVYTVK